MQNEQLKKITGEAGKLLAKASKELKAVGAELGADESKRLPRVETALDTLSLIELDALLEMLRRERDELKSLQAAALDQRRESVLKAARKHGWPAHRMQDYDKIGVFDLEYKSIKVMVKIGSEHVSDFEEADGYALFENSLS
jgi:BMFP domain-containing protein YqiC